MNRLLLPLLISLTACRHTPKPTEAENHFEHPEEWAARFEDPARDAWQKPEEVLAALALPKNAKVADIGSATGYFSVRFARALPEGTVYGVDVESAMVDYLAQRAVTENLSNLKVILGAYDDPKIPEPVDLIIVVNTYHHISDRSAYFARLFKSLTPNGRIAIIDFSQGSTKGPPDSAKVTPAVVTSELLASGFRTAGQFSFLPEQYFLVFGR